MQLVTILMDCFETVTFCLESETKKCQNISQEIDKTWTIMGMEYQVYCVGGVAYSQNLKRFLTKFYC